MKYPEKLFILLSIDFLLVVVVVVFIYISYLIWFYVHINLSVSQVNLNILLPHLNTQKMIFFSSEMEENFMNSVQHKLEKRTSIDIGPNCSDIFFRFSLEASGNVRLYEETFSTAFCLWEFKYTEDKLSFSRHEPTTNQWKRILECFTFEITINISFFGTMFYFECLLPCIGPM